MTSIGASTLKGYPTSLKVHASARPWPSSCRRPIPTMDYWYRSRATRYCAFSSFHLRPYLGSIHGPLEQSRRTTAGLSEQTNRIQQRPRRRGTDRHIGRIDYLAGSRTLFTIDDPWWQCPGEAGDVTHSRYLRSPSIAKRPVQEPLGLDGGFTATPVPASGTSRSTSFPSSSRET